jgi:putative hydrolase of the HAD superfamily
MFMIDFKQIKGIIFDYGATIDSNGKHWAEVLWDAYLTNQVPVGKSDFRDAYVYGERYLASHPVIKPHYTFREVLLEKVTIQLEWLIQQQILPKNCQFLSYSLAISEQCYNFALETTRLVRPVLEALHKQYPLALVSNFYGNIDTVLDDFGIAPYFSDIVESAVVGICKPDPAIFSLGVKKLNLEPQDVAVVGDSYKKDILPAQSIGCRTIWLKGAGWDGEEIGNADVVITDFLDIKRLFAI